MQPTGSTEVKNDATQVEGDGIDGKLDTLLKIYQEYRADIRHIETQRSAMVNMIFVSASGVIAVTGIVANYNKEVPSYSLPFSIALIILGVFGAIASASHSEHYNRARKKSHAYRQKIDSLVFAGELEQIREQAKAEADKSILRPIRWANLHGLWIILPLLVTIAGMILAVDLLRLR